MKRHITAAKTKEFWRYMSKRYESKIVEKRNSAAMRAIAEIFNYFGTMSVEEFLTQWSLTLWHNVYPCFTIGVGNDVALAEQCVTAVHEHVHVRQFGEFSFLGDYALHSADRTGFECEAIRAGMEIAFWFTGVCPDPTKAAEVLRGYQTTKADRDFAKAYLAKAATMIRRGAVYTPEAIVAIKWLEKNTEVVS